MSERLKVPMRMVQSMPQYQSRANQALNEEAVDEYADRYKTGKPMDPIQVCGQRHIGLFVVDGHHRFAAMKKAGFGPTTEIEVEVLDSRSEPSVVRWNAAGSNTSHGIRRTNADKRKAVTMVLQDFPDETDINLAEHCGVSRIFVYKMREELGMSRKQDTPSKSGNVPTSRPPQTPPPPQPREEAENVNINISPPPAQPHQNSTEGDAGQSVPPIPAPQRPQDAPPVPTTPPPPPPSKPESEAPKGEDYPWPEKPRPSFAKPEPEYKEGAGGHRQWIREKDDTSRYIPPELREFFARKGELMSVKEKLKRIHATLAQGVKDRDPLWCDITASIVEQLANVIKAVEDCDPLYVCPSCSGLNPGCQLCGNRNGFIGRRQLDIVKQDPALLKYMQRAERIEIPPPPQQKEAQEEA